MTDSTLFQQSSVWRYLSTPQRALIIHGQFLLEDIKNHPRSQTHDYSYVVFSFAKAYEGFLKQLFRDLGFIDDRQYNSDHFRVGKVLSPALKHRLGKRSVYQQLCDLEGDTKLAESLWQVWKKGRNQVFHYFPHNLKAISLKEAEEIIVQILTAMQQAYDDTYEHFVTNV